MHNETARLSRITAILIQLLSRKLVTATRLAEKFDVSVRTIYRDIRTLERAGVPIVTEDGKGFVLMEGFRMPPIMITEIEANALLTADLLIQASKDSSLIRNFSSVIAKVKAVIPSHLRTRIEDLENRIAVTNKYVDHSKKSEALMQFQSAILDNTIVEIDYINKSGSHTTRKVEPLAIYANQSNDWVLVAFCKLRKEFRSFSLSNVMKYTVTEAKFPRHTITLQQYLRQKYGN